MSDFALAPPMGDHYRPLRAFRLEGGGAGFLNSSGARAIATLAEVRPIDSPRSLHELCVAADGKVTIATSQEPGQAARVLVADSFEGPMRPVGSYLSEIGRAGGDQKRAWLVTDPAAGTSLVDCHAGKVEPLGPPSSLGRELHWTDAVQIVELRSASPPSDYCLVRTSASSGWTRTPACYARPRGDGSVALELLPPPNVRGTAKCSFVLSGQGEKLPCSAPVGPGIEPEPGAQEPAPQLANARFFGPSAIVVPGAKGELLRVGPGGKVDGAARIGSASLAGCAPLLPTMPVFRCVADGEADVVVRVDAEGKPHEELRRPRRRGALGGATPDHELAAMFHVTSDGGIAIGGDCEGHLGDVACVRDARGSWQNVRFSDELTKALSRTAPATRLVPSLAGELYVGAGTADGLLGGNVQILIFRADQGPGVIVEKIPAWIVGSLSGFGGLGAVLGAGGHAPAAGPSLSWSTSRTIRIWPLERQHPAFRTTESCRVDVALDGTFDTECLQGRLFAVGRLGLWEKGPGDLLETLDAGQSWEPVALPKGLETDDVVCTALGCRIGPYWRMGWGSSEAR
jgi:hypothetical protein